MMGAELHDSGEPLLSAIGVQPDWDAVFSEQLPRVYNFLRYRLGDDVLAEDLASLTFEKAWRERHRYRRDVSKFSTWLLTIARNATIDHRRTERRHAPIEAAVDVPVEASPEQEAMMRSNVARLFRLMAQLDDRERELLALKYGAGATNRAIADVTGLSESNVGTIVHRAVTQLRAKW